MINRNYGKLVADVLKYATNPLRMPDGKQIGNPTKEQYLEAGFKPIHYTDMPSKEGYYYTPVYTEADDKIIQSWEEHIIEED